METDTSIEGVLVPKDCCYVWNGRDYYGYKSTLCHGDEEYYWFGAAQSFRCGKDAHIVFCHYYDLKWVDGTGWTCRGKTPERSSAGRIDNPITHWYHHSQKYMF